MSRTHLSLFCLATILTSVSVWAAGSPIDIRYGELLKTCGQGGTVNARVQDCKQRNSEITIEGNKRSFGDEMSDLGWQLVIKNHAGIYFRSSDGKGPVWSPKLNDPFTFRTATMRCEDDLPNFFPETRSLCEQWELPTNDQYAAAFESSFAKVSSMGSTEKDAGWWTSTPAPESKQANDPQAYVFSGLDGQTITVSTDVDGDEPPVKYFVRCVCDVQ